MRASEYRVERARSGGYFVYAEQKNLGYVWTLLGAKNLIRRAKDGDLPGVAVYRERGR